MNPGLHIDQQFRKMNPINKDPLDGGDNTCNLR